LQREVKLLTPTIDTSKRAAILATIGGIGALVAFVLLARNSGGITLSASSAGAKTVWELATAGVFWATLANWFFEKWLWRLRWLQGWIVKIPDLTGIWEGSSESRHFKDKNASFQNMPISVEIDHRFDRIVYTQRGFGINRAFVADLSVDENGSYALVVVYLNTQQISGEAADPELAANAREHYGCARMVLERPLGQRTATRDWRLIGTYWTDKQRATLDDHGNPNLNDKGTWGKLDIQWKSRKGVKHSRTVRTILTKMH
jgi:hypothetical protein